MIKIENTDYLNNNENHPILFWDSVIKPDGFSNITFPGQPNTEVRSASNMWSPDTATAWEGIADELQYGIMIHNADLESVNCIAFSGHNLSNRDRLGAFDVQVYENSSATYVGSTALTQRYTMSSGTGVGGDGPIIIHFNATSSEYILVFLYANDIANAAVPPVISHMRLGTASVLERKTFTGTKMVVEKQRRDNRYSESGQYLGSIVKSRYKDYEIRQEYVNKSHVATVVLPFIEYINGLIPTGKQPDTFFYSPWPVHRQADCIYGWTDDNIEPEYTHGRFFALSPTSNGMMRWGCNIKGIA